MLCSEKIISHVGCDYSHAFSEHFQSCLLFRNYKSLSNMFSIFISPRQTQGILNDMSLSSRSALKSSFLARHYKIPQGNQRAPISRRLTIARRQLSPESFTTSSPEKIKAKSMWPSPRYKLYCTTNFDEEI